MTDPTLEELREEYEDQKRRIGKEYQPRDWNDGAETMVELADALIAALEQRVKELESDLRAYQDRPLGPAWSDLDATGKRADKAEARMKELEGWHAEALRRNKELLDSRKQAEAENERLRWMLNEAVIEWAMADSGLGRTVFEGESASVDGRMNALRARWTRREP